jgi:cell division protein ZapA
MAEISLNINGKSYGISCDDGQEQRVVQLGKYVDSRLREIMGAGAANNESHLLVLTALVLADEAFESREHAASMYNQQQVLQNQLEAVSAQQPAYEAGGISSEDEKLIVSMIDKLASRIDGVAQRLQSI